VGSLSAMAPPPRQARSPYGRVEFIDPRGGHSARPAVTVAAILLSCILITPARASPEEAPAKTFTVLGRVVDERRSRVSGALVRVHGRRVDDAPVSEGTTDARGRFRVEIPVADLVTASDAQWGVVVHHGGRVGVGSTTSSAHGVVFAGTIVVKPGLDVPVRLADRRAGVPVRARLSSNRGLPCAEAESDAEGRAVLRNVPPTWISIDAGELHAERDLEQERAPVPEVSLAARPLRPVVVGVTGVPPEARERTWVEVLHPRRFGRPIQRFSLARAGEGPLDVPPAALIRAVTEHPSPPRGIARWVELPAGASRVDVHVDQPIPMRWPVSAGSARVPPDGTVLRVRPLAGADQWAFPTSARVDRGHIAVDAVGWETQSAWAFAPDGSVARLIRSPYGRGPFPTKFQRARTIDVRLRETDGRPIVGALVGDYDVNRPPVLLPPTDANGRTRLVEFGEGPLHLRLAEGAPSWRALPKVESSGDATLDVVLPPKVTVVLRLLLDGRPSLPSRYNLSCLSQDIEDAEEDAERGEIRFVARPSEAGAPMTLFFGGAFGWTPEEGARLGGLRPTVVPGVPLTLRFRRLGIVRVRLSAPNTAADDGRRVVLETYEGDRWRTVSDKGSWNEDLSISAGHSLLMPLDRGTWRLRDEATGRATAPVVIGATAPEEIVERVLEIGP